MNRIALSKGLVALVDDEDFDRINRYNWSVVLSPTCRTYYAIRNQHFSGLFDDHPDRLGLRRQILVYMARQVLGLCTEDPRVVDHINHDTLDNRRASLRACTQQQNCWNRRRRTNVSSQYKGVSSAHNGRWQVHILSAHSGIFSCEIEAAQAYDIAAKEKFGGYAYLNFPSPNGVKC